VKQCSTARRRPFGAWARTDSTQTIWLHTRSSIPQWRCGDSGPQRLEGTASVNGLPWRVVALLGVTEARRGREIPAPFGQSALAVRHFGGRIIVVWLDSDAGDAVKVGSAVRAVRVVAGDYAPVVVAECPRGRKDSGE
jgi:hypothetical protein